MLGESAEGGIVVSCSQVDRAADGVVVFAAVAEGIFVEGADVVFLAESVVGVGLYFFAVCVRESDHVTVGVEVVVGLLAVILRVDQIDATEIYGEVIIIHIRDNVGAVPQVDGVADAVTKTVGAVGVVGIHDRVTRIALLCAEEAVGVTIRNGSALGRHGRVAVAVVAIQGNDAARQGRGGHRLRGQAVIRVVDVCRRVRALGLGRAVAPCVVGVRDIVRIRRARADFSRQTSETVVLVGSRLVAHDLRLDIAVKIIRIRMARQDRLSARIDHGGHKICLVVRISRRCAVGIRHRNTVAVCIVGIGRDQGLGGEIIFQRSIGGRNEC